MDFINLHINLFYEVLGIIMVLFGIYTTIIKIKAISKGEKDVYSYNLKAFISGVFFIIIGILVMIKYY